MILDTNVIISGLLDPSKDRPPALLLRLVLQGRLQPLLSSELLAEYVQISGRDWVRRAATRTREEVRTLLEAVALNARWSVPPPAVQRCPDADDQHLWDLLAAEPDAVLVTGERILLASDHFPGRVLSPRAVVDALLGSGG